MYLSAAYWCSSLQPTKPTYERKSGPRTGLGELVLMIQDVVFRLDKLKVSQGVPSENHNILRRGCHSPYKGESQETNLV
jgi:hypothetical protein